MRVSRRKAIGWLGATAVAARVRLIADTGRAYLDLMFSYRRLKDVLV